MSDSFFAVIPCTVLDDPSLPGDCKLFYATLTTLSRREGYAWASNQFLSEKTGKSERTIQRWIKLLCDGGHIKADITDSNQKRRIYITINPDGAATPDKNVTHDKNVGGGATKMSPPHDKNVGGRGDKNVTQVRRDIEYKELVVKDENKEHVEQKKFCSPPPFPHKNLEESIPETPNLGSQKKSEPLPAAENSEPPGQPSQEPPPTPKPPPPPKFQPEITEVIAYLNDLTGRNLSDQSAQTKFIRARLKDGATVDQLKRIVDFKAREWLVSPKMKKYLVPKTLFNKTNFENYLGEIEYLSREDGALKRLKIPINNYCSATGRELIWTQDEENALEGLAKKLRESMRKKGNSTDIESVAGSLQVLLERLPEWHAQKFSIINLNRNYNEIVNQILKSRSSNRGNATEWEIMRAKINDRKAGRNWA